MRSLFCLHCIAFDQKHVSHPYNKVSEEVMQDCHRKVREELASLLQEQQDIRRAVEDVRTTEEEIETSSAVISHKISKSYDSVIGIVEKKKESELRQFQSEIDAKLNEMETCKENLTSVLLEVNEVKRFVEDRVEGLGDAKFMACKKKMVLKINQMLHRIRSLPMSQPEASLRTHMVGSVSAEAVYLQPYRIVDPSLCTATVSQPVQVGVATYTSVLLVDSEGHPCLLQQSMTMELCSPRYGDRVPTQVVCQSPSHYEACYTPVLHTRGHCQLIIKVNGHMIGSEPIKVLIECPSQRLGEPVHIIDNIHQPGYLRIFNKQMFCSTPRGVLVIDLSDTSAPPGVFPRESALLRCEMAVDKEFGFVYVSEHDNNMVYKFSTDGQHLMSIHQNGSEPGKFNFCNGLCISRDGVLYICDSNNHRIQVFNQNLRFIRCFGSHGTAPGQFDWPNNIDLNTSGHIYMSDTNNHRVQCLTTDGDPIRCIGRQGRRPSEFTRPSILKVVGSHIFVTDIIGVSVFTTGGQFILRFASMCSAFCRSMDGLTVDEDGFVYVSDTSRDRIVIF